MSAKSGKLPQPDHRCCQRHDGQVVVRELLVARGHAAELFDPGKEALHLIALPVSRLVERAPAPVIASSRDHASDASAAQEPAVGAREIRRIGHDLARPAPRSAALAAAHLQAFNEGSKPLLITALAWRGQEEERLPLAALAAQAGISLRTAYKWLARYRSGGVTTLVDRLSVRCTQRRTLDPQQLQHAISLSHERCTPRRVARVLAAPLSTVGRVLKAIGLGRLKNL